MKKIIKTITASVLALAVAVVGLPVTSHAAGLAINATNFPDPAFRAYVMKNFDDEGNGTISSETLKYNGIFEMCGLGIKSLKGIEKFNVVYLDCSDNEITELDASKFKFLEYLDCSGNNLTSLTLCSSKQVDDPKEIPELQVDCSNNNITKLDTSKCTNLYNLNCSNNKLMSLDLSKNTGLRYLKCAGNMLPYVDLSKQNYLIDSVVREEINDKKGYYDYIDLRYNVYPIGKCESFSLAKISGFSSQKASNWKNASYDASTNTISGFNGDRVTYTYDLGNGGGTETFTFSFEEPPKNNSGGATVIPGFNYDGEGDHTVWANGKDIKDDKKTPDIDETKNYKTCTYLNTMMSCGGKWAVVVTDVATDTVEKLLALYNDKGALNDNGKAIASAAKKLASAKIKDGMVTVTAGKESGTVRVWVVEIKNKLIVVDDALGVAPQSSTVDVIAAPSSLCFAETGDVSNSVLSSGKKALSKVEIAAGDTKTIAYCDKKAAFSPAATFEFTNSAPTIASVTVVEGENNQLLIRSLQQGSTTLTLKNIESGKAVKLGITSK